MTRPRPQSSGSSPLARGLRIRLRRHRPPHGIIPARAGFTRSGRLAWAWSGDHPRSRGVYGHGCASPSGLSGSSPLARGLLMHVEHGEFAERIIPARAGFTGQLMGQLQDVADHPRSRGVYPHSDLGPTHRAGSSPLARGLPSWRTSNHPSIMDHPRSRGVYVDMWRIRAVNRGSSPLARGLPRRRCKSSASTGIIPARAGFTVPTVHYARGCRDHPRSRGVYVVEECVEVDGVGSSPLARGLLDVRRDTVDLIRIIPARAGFTSGLRSWADPSGDHPRSRGVYIPGQESVAEATGSSPLARGLLSGFQYFGRQTGIIPARAGFTGIDPSPLTAVEDHPRSRGVYLVADPTGDCTGGSSPLARGLHSLTTGGERNARIIPARAGFTGCHRSFQGLAADHPRSRGVYLCRLA